MNFENAYLHDMVCEGIRRGYEKKHKIDDNIVKTLVVMRKKFEAGFYTVPLVPLYTAHVLKKYVEFRKQASSSPYESDDFMDEYNILGSTSISSMIALDLILGTRVFSLAKKFFFRKHKNISYAQAYQTLEWKHLDLLLLTVFFNVPFYTSYSQLPKFTSDWEFASMGALFSTRVAKAFNLDEHDAETLFISALIKDVGKSALYWEMPLAGESNKRFINGYPEIQLDDELFDEVVWQYHPVISSQIAEVWGFSPDVIQTVIKHHEGSAVDDELITTEVRLLKFVNEMTDYISKNGLASLNMSYLAGLRDKLKLINVNENMLETLVDLIKNTKLQNMDQSLIDVESNISTMTTSYERLGADQSTYVVTPDSPFFQVNLLQDAKDKQQEFYGDFFFRQGESKEEFLERACQVRLLNAFYKAKDTNELAANLGTSVADVEAQLDKIQILEIRK